MLTRDEAIELLREVQKCYDFEDGHIPVPLKKEIDRILAEIEPEKDSLGKLEHRLNVLDLLVAEVQGLFKKANSPIEPQIKVGDRVRVVECSAGDWRHIGKTGILEEIDPGPRYDIRGVCYASKVRLVPEKLSDSAEKKLEDYFRGAVCECCYGGKEALETCPKCRKEAVKNWLESRRDEWMPIWGKMQYENDFVDWLLAELEREEK